MEQSAPFLTHPILLANSEVWFSAYGFGWGYRAFTLTSDAVFDVLGASNKTPKQVMLAFELGKRTIVGRKMPPIAGERIQLHAADL